MALTDKSCAANDRSHEQVAISPVFGKAERAAGEKMCKESLAAGVEMGYLMGAQKPGDIIFSSKSIIGGDAPHVGKFELSSEKSGGFVATDFNRGPTQAQYETSLRGIEQSVATGQGLPSRHDHVAAAPQSSEKKNN